MAKLGAVDNRSGDNQYCKCCISGDENLLLKLAVAGVETTDGIPEREETSHISIGQ